MNIDQPMLASRKLVNGTKFILYDQIDPEQCEAEIIMNYWRVSSIGQICQIFTINFADGSSEQFMGSELHKVIKEIISQPSNMNEQLLDIEKRKNKLS